MPGDPRSYQSVNPASGEELTTFESATDEDVAKAVSAAEEAYRTWKDVPIADRGMVVHRIGELFVERAEHLAALATEEMGKLHSKGVGEARFCGEIFRYYATEGPGLAADVPIKTMGGGHAVVQKLPLGVLLGIMPWNYPFYQVARFVAPNLMLGNTIILKHAESVPRCALAIEELVREAGVPEGAYVNVFASHTQIETIIADPRVQGVSLTGSERAGSTVGSLAGKHLKKCVLELGGSDPYIILDAPDLDQAAEQAWRRRLGNAGQTCNSNKRLIVMEELFDEFVERITQYAKNLRPGDPRVDEDDTYPPMASRAAAETLAAQVQDAVSKGAVLHAGGVLCDGPAAYFSPAVLTGVTKDMRAYSEELFGPVAVVYSVRSEDEAVSVANDTPYGLGGAVFSTDVDRARAVAQRLDVGMATVNAPVGEGAEIPFGGVKRSGFGRELGPLGMDEFVNKRLLYIA